jgi:hypothetical protein
MKLSLYPIVLIPKKIDKSIKQHSKETDRKTIRKPIDRTVRLEIKHPISKLPFIVIACLSAITILLTTVLQLKGLVISLILTAGCLVIFKALPKPTRNSTEPAEEIEEFDPDPQMTTFTHIEWSHLDPIQPIAISTAPRGYTEDFFEGHLHQHFPGLVGPGQEYAVPGKSYKYSSDIELILPNGLRIMLEIDEPFVLKTRLPHHCYDEGKDAARDLFFLNRDWIVIRFAEIQIATNPSGCCRIISDLLESLTVYVPSAGILARYEYPQTVRAWTIAEAKKMAASNYREQYLKAAGLAPKKTTKSAPKKISTI